MEDTYKYPVYFECPSLNGEQIKKIENYFHIRRKSGGGDCGSITKINDKVYSIFFKDRDAQQRVLQKSEHVLEVAGETLTLTVRGSAEPANKSESAKLNLTSSQSSQSIPDPIPPPSGEEYELHLESYLFRYLKESPEAEKKLERDLASVACSAQLYPEKEKVLVRSLAQPGAADEVQGWKTMIDKLFDGYLCHHEMDPRKIKALLQSCSSRQTTDEVKVYSEVGMAVVVGTRSQVNAKLMEVEDRSHLSEKQTSIRLLGEAKLRLLWKEIELGLRKDFPGVKVTRRDAGQLVLESSVEEILKAGAWISDREKLVSEKKVSDKSPHFLTFLKKAYGGPGELGDFLQVSDQVEIELRDTEIRFFAFSAHKLDETAEKLDENFKEVKINDPNYSTVPSELCEKLKSKTNELNQVQHKAQVVFGSDSSVCLLGHAKEVDELSETVTQFILDQSSPSSGTKVNNRHGSYMDTFRQESVIIESSEEVKYFRSPTEDDKLINVSRNLASLCLSEVASYSLHDGLQVLVCQGDITKLDADALVNAANEDLDHYEGVAAALSKAGGPQLQMESNALVRYGRKIPIGDVVMTTGGNLKCKKLLHAVVPVAEFSGGEYRALLENVVHSALRVAEIMEFESIAFPCMTSGSICAPVDLCSEATVTAVKEFASQGGRSLSRIILIDDRREVVEAMQEACDQLLQGISPENNAQRNLGFKRDAADQDSAGGATAGDEEEEGGVHVEIIQGTIETQQVDAVVSPMVGSDPLSTRVGNALYEMVGRQLTARFRQEAGEETQPGCTVLVEGFHPELSSNSVFFLSLIPWNDDEDGVAVQVLRLGINNILTSCGNSGITSVAFPLLGAGIALRFPCDVVAKVLLEEIHKFEQSRDSRAPLLVHIIIHPNDEESCEVFKSIQEDFQWKGMAEDVRQLEQESTTRRIILLGKTGAGKSNLANTIFGEKLFNTDHSPNSGTSKCQAETRCVNGRSITLIDTPGFFDANRSEEDIKPEIVRCITESAPGPHAFLIVLKVEKFTEQEQAVITKICQCFSEDALKYAIIVFTHGDDLPKGMKIQEFVSQNKNLSDLVRKCGGRCHVIDNKYWMNKMQNNYRSNQFQVEDLLNTVDRMVIENNGNYYINQMLQVVEEEIQREEEQIRKSSGNMPVVEIRKQAKTKVSERFLIDMAGTTTGALLGAFFGVAAMVGLVITALQNSAIFLKLLKKGGGGTVAAGSTVVAGRVAAGVVGVTTAGLATTGGVVGGIIGHEAAQGAETPMEAVEMAANAVINKGKAVLGLK